MNPSGETRELAHFSWLDVLLHTVRSLRNRVLYWSEPRHCSGRDSLLIATNTYGTYGVTLHVYRLRFLLYCQSFLHKAQVYPIPPQMLE